jgi:hypothetical protein
MYIKTVPQLGHNIFTMYSKRRTKGDNYDRVFKRPQKYNKSINLFREESEQWLETRR